MRSFVVIFLASLLLPAPALAGEKELLKKYPKLFSRKGKQLLLSIEGQKAPRAFTDNSTEGESYSENKLFSYIGRHKVAVIQTFGVEHGDYTLVSLRTGLELRVAEKPLWNKNLDAFVSVNEGEYADDKKGLQLGLCNGKECRLVLEKDGRYSLPKWTSAYRFQATNRIPSADGGEGLVLRERCTIQRKLQTATCVP